MMLSRRLTVEEGDEGEDEAEHVRIDFFLKNCEKSLLEKGGLVVPSTCFVLEAILFFKLSGPGVGY